jgi:glycine cleavage system H protein
MSVPSNLYFSKDHEWVAFRDNGTALIGVSGYAVEQLGDIVHIDFPKVGTKLSSSDTFGTIESTKTVSDLYSPCAGTVSKVNDGLINKLDQLQADPYEKNWLIELSSVDAGQKATLMTADQYSTFLKENS